MILNEAQRQLIAMRVPVGQLASICGVSKAAASKWISGLSKPAHKYRRKIRACFGPASETWDIGPVPTDPEPEPDAQEADARIAAQQYLRRIERLRSKADKTRHTVDLLKILDIERKAILALGTFAGEVTAVDETRLTHTSRWLAVRQRITETLIQFPAAAKAVAKSLEDLGA